MRFPHREIRRTKGSATLGKNEDRCTHFGAKILDKTWRRKGENLAKMQEELPQDTSSQEIWRRKYHHLGGRKTGGPVNGALATCPPKARGEDAEKRGYKAEGTNKEKQFSFIRRIVVNPTHTRGRKDPNSAATIRKEAAAL